MTLTTIEADPLLDLPAWVGQRQASFRFDLSDGVTKEVLGHIHPLRGQGRESDTGQFGGGAAAMLTHDTGRSIKRQLTFTLGKAETADINTIRDRVEPWMVFPNGQEFPLGRYMFTDTSRSVFTSGRLGNMVLNDEMFLVDQQITEGFNGVGASVSVLFAQIMEDLPVRLKAEPSPYTSTQSWGIGAGRGQVLEALAVAGDYFSPWFDNNGDMRLIRSFDPFTRVPDFDFDAGNKVVRAPITETDDLLTAPNLFMVVSNASTDLGAPVTGEARVPATAPHSVTNRGFEIPQVMDLQVADNAQAQAVAQNLANRQTVFERVTLATAPDPRHDAYNVVKWRGSLWLELGWAMGLSEGAGMAHTLRKAYRP